MICGSSWLYESKTMSLQKVLIEIKFSENSILVACGGAQPKSIMGPWLEFLLLLLMNTYL